MFKNKWLFLLLITFLMVSEACGETLESNPEWLHGKVAIDLYGDDRLLGAWPYERYICIFNMDNNQIDSIKIPDESVMLKEWEAGGRVAFVYPHTTGFNYMDDYSTRRWRDYEYIQIIPVETEEGTIYKRGESEFDWLNDDDAANERIFYDHLWMDSPLRILGLSGNDDPVFNGGMKEGLYLMYGLSDGGELELQLQKFEKDSCSVLYHFPLDHDFGAWQYAISPTGKIAWWSKPDELLCVKSDGVLAANGEIKLNNALAWKNDTELLYFAATETKDRYVVKEWNISTGACDVYLNSAGREVFTKVYPRSMAINDDGNILAVYGSMSRQNVIQFINLKIGETHTMYPWTIENCDERSDFRWYGISDQGVMYYSSGNLLQSQLLWVSD